MRHNTGLPKFAPLIPPAAVGSNYANLRKPFTVLQFPLQLLFAWGVNTAKAKLYAFLKSPEA